MIWISHRGNINGKFESYENEPNYIDNAISEGYDVEIDVWYKDGILWLGHDTPQYSFHKDMTWFKDRIHKLMIHCKNPEAASFFYFENQKFVKEGHPGYHYFCHETDTIALTSKGYMLGYPGKQPMEGTIAMMPEYYDDDISDCIGVCSDDIAKYREVYG